MQVAALRSEKYAVVALGFALAACGGSTTPTNTAAKAPETQAAAPQEAAKEEPIAFPTACSEEGGDMCVPSSAFARRVCAAGSPEMALALFAKGTPWIRGYMARATEAWDASGGPSSSDKLELDEEVLILVRRTPNTGGMVVSGASGSYDVLRWDGTCASLGADEVRTRQPGAPGHAEIPWRKLDEPLQKQLESDAKIASLVADQKKECKGVSKGQTTPRCEKASKALSRAIVAYVRRGGALPKPPELR